MIFTAFHLEPASCFACEMPSLAQAVENGCGERGGQRGKETNRQRARGCSSTLYEIEDARDHRRLALVEGAADCDQSGEIHVGFPTPGNPPALSRISDRLQIGFLRGEHVLAELMKPLEVEAFRIPLAQAEKWARCIGDVASQTQPHPELDVGTAAVAGIEKCAVDRRTPDHRNGCHRRSNSSEEMASQELSAIGQLRELVDEARRFAVSCGIQNHHSTVRVSCGGMSVQQAGKGRQKFRMIAVMIMTD